MLWTNSRDRLRLTALDSEQLSHTQYGCQHSVCRYSLPLRWDMAMPGLVHRP